MMRLFTFFGLLFALFGIYLTQYINQSREAYNLWVQEIVYGNRIMFKSEKLKLFSKIESLAKEICQLADSIYYLFTILCFTFLITITLAILELKSLYIIVPNETANASILKLLTSSDPVNREIRILIASLTLSIIMFFSLPKILKDAHINIINPSNTSRIDEKVFYVWYKYRCFEHKRDDFRCKLQPRRLYEILARKYEDKEKIDGKNIEISEKIIEEMKSKGFFKKKRLNP